MSNSLKELARNGDTKALEALMNKSFASKGVVVRVTNSSTLLKISLRGKTAPPESLAAQISKGLDAITPTGFDKVIVTAETIGGGRNWKNEWSLSNSTQRKPSLIKSATSSSNTVTSLINTDDIIPFRKVVTILGIAVGGLVSLSVLAVVVGAVMLALDNGSSNLNAALEYADEASKLIESADTEAEWRRVTQKWAEAITELEQVPESSNLNEQATAKLTEFKAKHEQAEDEVAKFVAEKQAEAQARAQRKAAADRRTQQATAVSRGQALEIFRKSIREVDPSGSLVTSVNLWEFDDEGKTVEIHISSGWHYQPKAAREDAATGLYKLWLAARVGAGLDTENTYMRITSASGKEVGGYGPLKGIYIKDE